MLTPDQLMHHSFSSFEDGRYSAEEVNRYFGEVIASYNQMYRENGELIRKLSILANKVQEYRRDEENIQNTLLVAQRSASQVLADASKQSEGIISAAKQEMRDIVSGRDGIVTKANIEAQKIIDEAHVKAENIQAKAMQDVEEFRFTAETKAGEITAEANKAAEKIIDDANAEAMDILSYAKKEAEEIQKEAKSLQENLDNYQKQIAQLQAQINSLEMRKQGLQSEADIQNGQTEDFSQQNQTLSENLAENESPVSPEEEVSQSVKQAKEEKKKEDLTKIENPPVEEIPSQEEVEVPIKNEDEAEDGFDSFDSLSESTLEIQTTPEEETEKFVVQIKEDEFSSFGEETYEDFPQKDPAIEQEVEAIDGFEDLNQPTESENYDGFSAQPMADGEIYDEEKEKAEQLRKMKMTYTSAEPNEDGFDDLSAENKEEQLDGFEIDFSLFEERPEPRRHSSFDSEEDDSDSYSASSKKSGKKKKKKKKNK